jgi:hypothetical protein
MSTSTKKSASQRNKRAIKLSTEKAAEAARPVRAMVKRQEIHTMQPKKRPTTIADEYLRVFKYHPSPNQGMYTDHDSLEQPSELRYVLSTTSPYAEV